MEWEIIVGSIVTSIMVAFITGAVSGNRSAEKIIAALVVHIDYLRADIHRHDAAITRAHTRIDDIEKRAA